MADALILMLGKVHSALTVTLDNGGEFADHARVSNETGAAMYFARPYASWQRGTNENTNGRLRRFWPKRFDLATLSEQEIQDGVFVLNLRITSYNVCYTKLLRHKHSVLNLLL